MDVDRSARPPMPSCTRTRRITRLELEPVKITYVFTPGRRAIGILEACLARHIEIRIGIALFAWV